MTAKIDYNKAKRQEKQLCRGISEDGSACRYAIQEGKRFCTRSHSDMEDYTEEMLENLQLCKSCPRSRWRYFGGSDRCESCQAKQPNQLQIYCQGTEKGSDKRCRLKVKPNKRFCERNHKYMEDYTDEMMDDLATCTGCKRSIYSGYFNGLSTCKDCQDRCAKNRVVQRKSAEKIKRKCCHEGCAFSAKNDANFCDKHKLDQFVIDVTAKNKKVCANYIRGCIESLDLNYTKTKCEICLEKDRIYDREKHAKKKEAVKKKGTDTHRYCVNKNCGKQKSIDEFKVNNVISDYCSACRQERANNDRGRIKNKTTTNEIRIKEIKRKAPERGINFEISDEKVLELIQQPCRYCGIYYSSINAYGETYSEMGIDRIDNNGNYTNDNVVIACWPCNRMKFTSKYDDFFKYCVNIFENFGSENEWRQDEKFKRIRYSKHKADSKNGNKITELTSSDVKMITSKKCYYCNSTNRTDQIGIDRIDSNIGYTKHNKLVACCGVCNCMKSDTPLEQFYNNVLKILLHHKYIDQETHDKNIKHVKKPTSRTKAVNEALSKIYEYDGKENKDRRNVHNFNQASQFYIDNIWKGFNIQYFEPELEFCETREQIDTWMFYRLTISSHYPSKCSSLDKKILIRDKFTKQYVALTSLCRVRPGWSDKSNIGKLLRNNNVYNISTCVAIPPFSFNFVGGKLATMMMFSKEVYEHMENQGIIIAGLMTYSLHGDSYQYSDLDNFKLIGYSQGKSGKDNTRVPDKVYNAMINIMRKRKYPITSSKPNNIKYYCACQGLLDASVHGVKRAIYFGTTGENAIDFLMGNTGEFEPKNNTVSEIAKTWYVKYVVPRIDDLVKRNKIMVSYDYDTYYADKSGYDRNRKKKSLLNQKTNLREKEANKRNIINCWIRDPTQSWTDIEKTLNNNVDRRTITNLIIQNDYKSLNGEIKAELKSHIRDRVQLTRKRVKDIKLTEKVDAIIEHERQYSLNSNNEEHVTIKKTKLYFTNQKYDNVKYFSRFFKLDDIKQGVWNVTTICENTDDIIQMRHTEYDNLKTLDDFKFETTLHFFECDDILFKLGIAQSDKEFNLNDLDVINAPFKITGKNNIFIDIKRMLITDQLEILIDQIHDKQKNIKHVIGIHIRPINNRHKVEKNVCYCDHCINFLIKSTGQTEVYNDAYLDMIIRANNNYKNDFNIPNDNDYSYETDLSDNESLDKDTTCDNEPIVQYKKKLIQRPIKKYRNVADKIVKIIRKSN